MSSSPITPTIKHSLPIDIPFDTNNTKNNCDITAKVYTHLPDIYKDYDSLSEKEVWLNIHLLTSSKTNIMLQLQYLENLLNSKYKY